MSLSLKRQDMPPAGGYSPINYKRLPAKSYFSAWGLGALYFGVTTFGLYLYSLNYSLRSKEEIEMRSSRMAIYPMIVAENDRNLLRQLRKNRDHEAELMKNVEGWEVGTLYGEPVYKTLPEDTVIYPTTEEFYAHSSRKDVNQRYNAHLVS